MLPYRRPFIEGRSATCKLLSDSCLTVFRVVKTPTLKTAKALIISDLRVASCIQQWLTVFRTRQSEEATSEVLPGHHQMPGRSWRAGKAQRRWKARRP